MKTSVKTTASGTDVNRGLPRLAREVPSPAVTELGNVFTSSDGFESSKPRVVHL